MLGTQFFVAIDQSLGGGKFDALYLCVACALSSTVIIVKVLNEKRELDAPPGRITLGVLVLQDICRASWARWALIPRDGRSVPADMLAGRMAACIMILARGPEPG